MRIVLALTVAAAVSALTLLASGLNGGVEFGPLSISVNDVRKPFLLGTMAGVWLLIAGWRHVGWRRFAIAALAATGLLGIVAHGRMAAPIITDSDFAVGELYADLATRGELLVGPYSRFGWHHPGPLYFYLQGPFYALGGRRAPALYAVALAVNVVAIVTLTWVIARERHRWPLAVLLVVGCVLFAWRVPMFLASPWTAHVPILPGLAFLVVAAAVASGRLMLLPLMTVGASFVTQTHVGFIPVVGLVTAVVLVWCVVDRTDDRRQMWSALNRSAWTAAVLWLVPISEAVAGAGGNAVALWRFFVLEGGARHSWREAFVNWSHGLTGVLRPDFTLPWGGHFELSHLTWAIPVALGQLALLGVIARVEFRRGRKLEGWLALIAAMASAAAFWSLTRIRGDILNHDLFRIASLGAFNLAIIAAALVRVALGAGQHAWSARPFVPVTAFLVVFGLVSVVGERDLRLLTSFERRRTERAAIVTAHGAIRDYVNAEGIRRPLIRIDDDRWGDAAGILLRLQQDGIAAAVEDAWRPMFTDVFAANGGEDAVITLANLRRHRELLEQPGTVALVKAGTWFVDVTRGPPPRP